MTWEHPRGYGGMAATAQGWRRAHPEVEIVWEQRSLQAFADHPVEELAAEYDLIVIDHPHVGDIARKGCLVPLDQAGHDAELATLASQSLGLSHPSYEWEGHQWALAIDAATQVSAYRPDLLAHPPQTWNEVIDLAHKGKVLWPIKPVDALMSFLTLAANRGTPCGQRPDQLIEADDGLAVLEALAALARHVPRRCLSMNPIETLEQLSGSDDSAYCPLLYGYSNYARRGFRPALVKFANMPAIGEHGPRGSTLGGTGIAVSALCREREVAVDYAFWVASADVQRGIYFDGGGQPGNAVAWGDDRVNAASSNFFRDTRETLDRAVLRPRYAGYLDLQDRGGTIVNRFLSGGIAAKPALEALNDAYRTSQR